jgi:molybdopterin-binding protein
MGEPRQRRGLAAILPLSSTAHLEIELSPGLTVAASIANESVDDRGLKVGDEVSAVIKSSDVMIGK